MKVKRIFQLIGVISLILVGVYLTIEPLYTPTALFTPSSHSVFPRYIAHKALISGDYVGNTLKAIQEALSSYVDGIEVDVRMSKDGVLFLFHPETLEEYTNGYGKPEEQTWKYLQSLVYEKDKDSKIISLEKLFKVVGSQKFIFLDIKTDKILNKKFSVSLAKLIQQYHLQESVVVESFNPFFLTTMRLTARDILLMYDFNTNSVALGEEVQLQFDKIPWILKQPYLQKQIRRIVRPDILGPRLNCDEALFKTLIEHGYPIISWTIDDPLIAQDLFKMGIKGLQTNKPLELLTLVPSQQQNVYDAGGAHAQPYEVVHVKNTQDILNALTRAKEKKKKLTIAGRRHSMGGQTLLKDSIQLNMLGFNAVTYNPKTHTVKAEAGASWKKIQAILDQNGRSISVMQSDNIFSIGGSLSVNVHGWQRGSPPLASSVLSMKVITADGKIRTVGRAQESELFKAILGGYGMFAIILEAEFITLPNSSLTFHAHFIPPEKFMEAFQNRVTNNLHVELVYGRLSVDEGNLFKECGLFWYEKDHNSLTENLRPESSVAMKRGVFRLSQYFEMGKKFRWFIEKRYAQKLMQAGSISRNNAMNTDIHILWPLYGKSKDILHEYFIPKKELSRFLHFLKKHILEFNMNILNVTIREVTQDKFSLLPYATEDMFALVCLFSQQQETAEEEKMRRFTQKVIQDVLLLKGTFYLPYRLHYTKDQLLQAYPSFKKWIQVKQKWDPDSLFNNQFFQYVSNFLS